ncbi:MAG: DUF3380 domain-containing protein [Aquamicrobium sp.]|nr:DUF3380 domain-containing protein [Aquamicrobium sp.]
MLGETVLNEIEKVAQRLRIEPAALAAVAHIESGLRTHAMVGGRAEPLIRFEGHYFDRRLSGAKREEARRAGLASPEAGAVANPASQAARWSLLSRAARLDRRAAYESVSWGIGQVMGTHWAWLGYASVDALAEEARSGVAGQLRLMARYIDKAGLAEALRRRDWAAFGRGYNGPGFRRNGYDLKLARAYARYSRGKIDTRGLVLRRGMRGDAVRNLQLSLGRHGFSLQVDGIFGPRTEDAVRRFQERRGLVVDGIVGSASTAALEASESRSFSVSRWIGNFLKRHFGRTAL